MADAPAAIVRSAKAEVEILAAYTQFEQCGRDRLKAAFLIGKLLSDQKKKVEHGDWNKWIEANCKFDRYRAAEFMRLHEHKAKCRSAETFEDALKLAKPDPEDSSKKTDGKTDDPKCAESAHLDSNQGESESEVTETESAPAKPVPKAKPDPIQEGVEHIQQLCRSLDSIKAAVKEFVDSGPWRRFIHVESIIHQIEATRKALWQSRPTEVCNCVKANDKPLPQCKACFGTGKTPSCRVLGGRH